MKPERRRTRHPVITLLAWLLGSAVLAVSAKETQAADPAVAAREAASTAVASALPRWKAACWDTANAETRKAGGYVAVMAFDSAGRLVIFGVSEDRDTGDPAIARCLRRQANPFTVSAVGYATSFEVPFAMP
jgi:hypothetical protein